MNYRSLIEREREEDTMIMSGYHHKQTNKEKQRETSKMQLLLKKYIMEPGLAEYIMTIYRAERIKNWKNRHRIYRGTEEGGRKKIKKKEAIGCAEAGERRKERSSTK